MSNERSGPGIGTVLTWDSEFFGFRIGRAPTGFLAAETLGTLLAWSETERLRCLYFFADGNDRQTLECAHVGGFKFVDVRVDLACERSHALTGQTSGELRPMVEADTPALEAIARIAHTDTRFFKDRNFPRKRAADLYAQWILRDFREHHVFVIPGASSAPAGYVTCQMDAAKRTGRIGLIAVAESEQNRGYGRALVQGALRWFRDVGCEEVRVATQAANVRAQRLYQSLGFRTAETNATFHRWF